MRKSHSKSKSTSQQVYHASSHTCLHVLEPSKSVPYVCLSHRAYRLTCTLLHCTTLSQHPPHNHLNQLALRTGLIRPVVRVQSELHSLALVTAVHYSGYVLSVVWRSLSLGVVWRSLALSLLCCLALSRLGPLSLLISLLKCGRGMVE